MLDVGLVVQKNKETRWYSIVTVGFDKILQQLANLRVVKRKCSVC